MKEKLVVSAVRKYLAGLGWFVIKIHGSIMQLSGLPDLLCLKRGTYIWLECKAPGGRLSKRQEYIQHVLRSHGALVYTVDDVENVRFIVEALTARRAS